MIIDGYEFMTDTISKFFRSVLIKGWFHSDHDDLASVRLIGRDIASTTSEVCLPHGGVLSLGPNKGFQIQALFLSDVSAFELEIEFRSQQGWVKRVSLADLSADRRSRFATLQLWEKFKSFVDASPNPRLLDIGGRDRSKLDRSKLFPKVQVTVLDILPGSNVDVVGDAHALSKHFKKNTFDFVHSVSVFEHLLMPWTVVCEMNKVLKQGGIGLVSTHQTLGMHDRPWDFWRFSDTAWQALFNKHTGFEILDVSLDSEQYVIPFVYRRGKEDAEKSAGFEGSAILFRKISQCRLSWPLQVADVLDTNYPDNDDGQSGDEHLMQ